MITAAHFPVTETQLDAAYRWLCQQRQHYNANADIWDLRHHWTNARDALLHDIRSGNYSFSPLQRIHKSDGQVIHLWCARDALVNKLLANHLSGALTFSPACTHVKGHGGLKQSIVETQRQLPHYRYVCKTDVKRYYESIDHVTLMSQLDQHIDHPILRRYVWHVVQRTIEWGGTYRDIQRGISRGCPLSPLFGALYLTSLDEAFRGRDVHYIRYMDDILILSKTRWHNRRAVKILNEIFKQLTLKQHPDKTFIGRIDKGFDFLGYHFSRKPLRLADITVKKHLDRRHRLYEQRDTKKPPRLRWLVCRATTFCAGGAGAVQD